MIILENIHPGKILKEEFLIPYNLSCNALSKAIFVPNNRISSIVKGVRSITAETDLRLCKFFGLSEGFFIRLQEAYDILEAKRSIDLHLEKIQPLVQMIA